MSSLKLPEPITVSKQITKELDELERKGGSIASFCGYANIETLFYLYLIKKYKSKCVSKKTGYFDKSDTLLGMTISMSAKLTPIDELLMSEEFTDLAKTLTQCIKKGEETIIIPLRYCCVKLSGHSNVLIYRRRTNTIEHFEPHGGEIDLGKKMQENLEKRINFFIRIFNAELKKNNIQEVSYVPATSVCPYLEGLQSLENNSILKKTKGEPGGYCSVWSMFFAELCLKNPDKSSEEILENIYNYLTTKESAESYLKKVIRGYTGYLVESVNTYLKIFFKPTYTVTDVIGFSSKATNKKYVIMMDAIKILIELESEILLDDDYNLAADLSRVKKMYKNSTRDMSIEQQRAAREKNQALRFLYYRKRILQNYEEYSNYGKISEPVADSPLELMRETIKVNPFLSKRQKTQKAIEVLEPVLTKAKTQRRRLSPNTIQEREAVKQSRKAINDLIRKEREAKKEEKLMAKLPIDKNPYFL
jgi:hypothetical protein